MNKYYEFFLKYNNKLMLDLFDSFEKHNILKKIKFVLYADSKNKFIFNMKDVNEEIYKLRTTPK